MTDLDTKALEAAARAVYAVLPNFGMEWQPNTAGGSSQVRVDDAWEDAPDRHEDCTRQAQAAIEAYLSAARDGWKTFKAICPECQSTLPGEVKP